MTQRIYISIGERFGRLRVVRELDNKISSVNGRSLRQYQCECDCGTLCNVAVSSLRRGYTKSCGCLRRDVAVMNATGLTHGMTETKTYASWEAMKQRCLNPRHRNYRHYGGRGISICDRWLRFECFLEDMGERPPGMTLDRINNSGNYEPSNCRWTTQTEQTRNTRNNTMLTLGSETMCIADWSERTGLASSTICSRLHYGYTVKEALTFPLHIKRNSAVGIKFAAWLEEQEQNDEDT